MLPTLQAHEGYDKESKKLTLPRHHYRRMTAYLSIRTPNDKMRGKYRSAGYSSYAVLQSVRLHVVGMATSIALPHASSAYHVLLFG